MDSEAGIHVAVFSRRAGKGSTWRKCKAMHNDPASHVLRLRRMLRRLPPADLDHLVITLASRGGRRLVEAIVAEILHDAGYWLLGPNALRDAGLRRQREWFYFLLNDRHRFPTTRDLVDCINAALGCDFRYEQFRQSGRLNLCTKTWSFLLGLPEEERASRIKDFMVSAFADD